MTEEQIELARQLRDTWEAEGFLAPEGIRWVPCFDRHNVPDLTSDATGGVLLGLLPSGPITEGPLEGDWSVTLEGGPPWSLNVVEHEWWRSASDDALYRGADVVGATLAEAAAKALLAVRGAA